MSGESVGKQVRESGWRARCVARRDDAVSTCEHFTCRGIAALVASTFSSAAVASAVSACSRSFELRVSSLSLLSRTWDG